MIELLIVIVGVLFGISLPAYQGYVLRSHRADGQSSLLDIAARQERFVAQNNTYTTEISAATGLGVGRTTSAEGYFNMSVALTYDNAGAKGPAACW